MDDHNAQTSPQVYARTGGAFYLIIIVFGIFGEVFVRSRLIVPGDASATAERIMNAESVWRFSIAGELFMLTCAVGLALIFYVLLRPVSRNLALLATFFNLISIALEAANKLQLIVTLFPLVEADYLRVFDPQQLHALAYLHIKSHGYGFGVSLIFFGCVCLLWGHLIFRSGYLPRLVGLLMQIAGICYLTNSFALILSPAFADRLFPLILLPPFVAETSLCLWLLIRGVNLREWAARTSPDPGAGAPTGGLR